MIRGPACKKKIHHLLSSRMRFNMPNILTSEHSRTCDSFPAFVRRAMDGCSAANSCLSALAALITSVDCCWEAPLIHAARSYMSIMGSVSSIKIISRREVNARSGERPVTYASFMPHLLLSLAFRGRPLVAQYVCWRDTERTARRPRSRIVEILSGARSWLLYGSLDISWLKPAWVQSLAPIPERPKMVPTTLSTFSYHHLAIARTGHCFLRCLFQACKV